MDWGACAMRSCLDGRGVSDRPSQVESNRTLSIAHAALPRLSHARMAYGPAHPPQAATILSSSSSSSSSSSAAGNGGTAAPSVVTLKNQFRQRLREEKAKALEGGGEKRIKKQVGWCVWGPWGLRKVGRTRIGRRRACLVT